MKWRKYSVNTVTSMEQEIADLLYDMGIDAVEISDNMPVMESIEKEGGFFEELQPNLPQNDGRARVIFYLEEKEDGVISEADENLVSKLRVELDNLSKQKDIGEGTIEVSVSDEKDWRDNWKKYFHPLTIGDILIKPSWEKIPEGFTSDKIIEIDPGISFGTGSHETTKMCISAMQKYIKDKDNVLDVGFGSGILSIAAIKCGASYVCGTDIDEDCIDSVKTNFAMNNIDMDKGGFYIGDLSSDEVLFDKVGSERYDIVLANILADIIIGMKDKITSALKPGGIFIASGIIDFKEDAVKEAIVDSKLEIIEINHDGEWVEITAKKPL